MRSVVAACLPAVCACRALSHGLMVMPGVMTLTEAFLGIKHGARLLKLFPSSVRSSLNQEAIPCDGCLMTPPTPVLSSLAPITDRPASGHLAGHHEVHAGRPAQARATHRLR